MLLMLVGIVNTCDRLLPGILIEPIKHDLALSDTAIGLINGFGFLVVYAAVGLPIARLSDRGIFGFVIAGALGLWSVMTVLGAFAQSGWQFALSRLGVAVGEAGSAPASHAFIAANFPAHRRALPLAILTLSLPLAIVLGTWGGAALGHWLGWRAAFLAMGVVGVLLSPAVLLVVGRGAPLGDQGPASAPWLVAALALLRKPSFVLILLAVCCVAIGGYSLGAFGAAFLMRVHHMKLAEMGMMYGIASGVSGAVGLMIAGISADRLSARDPRWSLWVLALMIVILLPAATMAFLVPNVWAALTCMALIQIVGVAYLAPVIAAIQRLAPTQARATASALLLAVSSIAGGLGPLLIGIISDSLQDALGELALGRALLMIPAVYALAAGLFVAGTFSFRRDIVSE